MKIRRKQLWTSLSIMITGAYAMGIGTGIALLSTLSGDSVAFLWKAISTKFLISVETANACMTVGLILYVIIQDRTILGIGTILCPLIQNVGIMTIGWLDIHSAATILTDWFYGLFGLVILAVGCGMVAFAKMGLSSYLAAAKVLEKKLHWNYGAIIMFMDGVCFVVACLFEQRLAVGPLIATVVNGPIIDRTIKILEKIYKARSL